MSYTNYAKFSVVYEKATPEFAMDRAMRFMTRKEAEKFCDEKGIDYAEIRYAEVF